jgi:hypothetical protein
LVLIVIEINGLYHTVQIADTGKNRRLVMGQHYRLPFLAAEALAKEALGIQ